MKKKRLTERMVSKFKSDDILMSMGVDSSVFDLKIIGLYEILCVPEDMFYIGRSKKNVYSRMINRLKENEKYSGPQGAEPNIFYQHIHKYNVDDFEFRVIATFEREEDVILIEKLLISYFNSITPEKLYNKGRYHLDIPIQYKKMYSLINTP